MSVVQFFLYLKNYPKDNRWIRVTVWSTFSVETVITVLTGIASWNTFGVGWGNNNIFLIIDKSWTPLPILNSLPAMIVQTFFAWRIWKLTRKMWIACLITTLAVVGSAIAWYYNIRIDMMGRRLEAVLSVGAYSSVYQARESTSVARTAATLMNIMKFTIETGLITAMWSILELTLWLSMPGNSFHWILWVLLVRSKATVKTLSSFLARGRIYNNWLLATLNSRIYVSSSTPSSYISMNQAQSAIWADLPPIGTSGGVIQHRLGRVRVTTTTEAHTDRDNDQEMVIISASASQTKAEAI
ncbi:hypothetical protein EYR40_002950 [Pleurotus pulmonarius]|nr:hypothetical protein EYR36_003143 [Pleurotus pulmonarius]KAF4581362.1 hypothetical protein EYR40_002950 [Pleurotus pulmonarius]KAF4582494.1 hypothetical protein EYR38_002620 [Pleurotus pulmonarius]